MASLGVVRSNSSIEQQQQQQQHNNNNNNSNNNSYICSSDNSSGDMDINNGSSNHFASSSSISTSMAASGNLSTASTSLMQQQQQQQQQMSSPSSYVCFATPLVVAGNTADPLPTCWSPKDVSSLLGLSYSSRRINYRGQLKDEMDAAAVRANHSIPPSCGIFYFEVYVVSKGREGHIAVGLSASDVSLNRLPGWEKGSYAYHADDGNSFCSSGTGTTYGPTYTSGDTVGVCINFADQSCFFTKNGLNLGIAFRDLKGSLYPTVGLRTPGECVEANFGHKSFVFDIASYCKDCREQVTRMIESIPSPSSGSVLSSLVLGYLSHHGYAATLETLARDTHITYESDMMESRQAVRRLILAGDMDGTIELLEQRFPLVISDINIVFLLRCQKFIELVREAAAVKGGVDVGASVLDNLLEFGRMLQVMCDQEFSISSENRQCLSDAFSLLAYPDVETSPVAMLLSSERREEVAITINAAILSRQGLPAEPALQQIVRALIVSREEAAQAGAGNAALLHVQEVLS